MHYLFFGFILVIHSFATAGHFEYDCPDQSERAAIIVQNFLTKDAYYLLRQENSISASADSIRALNNLQDSEACAYLSSTLDVANNEDEYRKYAFYKAGEYYFVLKVLRPPSEWPEPDADWAPSETAIVFDQDFEPMLPFLP